MNTDVAQEQNSGNRAVNEQREYRLKHIYLKDASLETPSTPSIFVDPLSGEPEVTMDLTYQHKAIDADTHEVVLHISMHMRIEDSSMYLVEVDQAAIVVIKGFSKDETRRLLGTTCPAELFPYAREAVASMVSRSGFPTIVIQPIDFAQLYAK